ncbi:MAG: glycosyltransferase family 9 protein [Rhabdochlamydiaceae bacterium]
MKKCAVFSCLGLGDGLIALVLSNNLSLNGWEVTTFHPFLKNFQKWFPHLPLSPFPPQEELESVLKNYDRFFLIYEKSPWMQAVLTHCQNHDLEQTMVLNPIATPHRDYPYWEQGRFDGRRSFVENLYTFCHEILKFTVVTKGNGITIPDGVQPRRFKNRVVIHPTSSRNGKNWTVEKYLKLGVELQARGFHPSLILTEEERLGSNFKGLDAPLFSDPLEMTAFVCESGYMIGNDSGVGHLASCLGLPTVTICRSEQNGRFWRPAWAPGKVITPSKWIPNLKGLRWRDKHWKQWISVRKVLSDFLDLNGND